MPQLSVVKNPIRRDCLPSGVPVRVAVAIDFIRQCNEHMGLQAMGWSGEQDATDVRSLELHAKQEAAFDRACNCLGKYFDGTLEAPEYGVVE